LVSISMKQLLEAGVHFGHQTKRWNPKMKEYIFGERNGIYIIDLQKSLKLFKEAISFVYELGAHGKSILFLGTKRQAQEVIQEEAQRCGMYYVNQRWLGGLLTNFATIQKSIKRYAELEGMKSGGQYDLFSKKEVSRYERERKKLEKNLIGIKEMSKLPDAVFVIDTKKEGIAVQEARKLGIPIIGVADTNCNPDEIDYIVPGNDDALRAIRLIANTIAQALLDGRAVYEAQQKELAAAMEKQRQIQAQQAAAAREASARVAAAAAEAAARRAAESRIGEEPAVAADAAGGGPDAGGRPRTTVRRTLQRKARPKKREPGAQAEDAQGSTEEPSAPAAVPEAEPPSHAAEQVGAGEAMEPPPQPEPGAEPPGEPGDPGVAGS
jgi:small subunit ribosomal protein S2